MQQQLQQNSESSEIETTAYYFTPWLTFIVQSWPNHILFSD